VKTKDTSVRARARARERERETITCGNSDSTIIKCSYKLSV
jgi:hypothetical protein